MDNNQWEYDYSHMYNQAQNTPNAAFQTPSTAPDMQPQPPVKKKRKGLRILAGFLAVVAMAGVGFGGGYMGSIVAMKNAPPQQTVVVQSAVSGGENGTVNNTSNNNLSISDIAEQAKPSVVAIIVTKGVSNGFFGGGTKQGAGSGVIISQDGYILTNYHVIEGANSMVVTTEDGTEYPATVIGGDKQLDVAVIKIDGKNFTPAVIGDSDTLRVGDTTIAIGNPLGTLSGTVTTGIVSALNRAVNVEGTDMNLIQTSASINPGNSGGGLFNANAQLVGIVNAGATSAEGVGFAIPINEVMKIATDIMENGKVTTRPAMGVTVIAVTDAQTALQLGVNNLGVYIQSVNDGSAAQDAGLLEGDLFISIDGKTVNDTSDISNILATKAVGDEVEIQVARDRQIVSVNLILQSSN